MAKSKVAIAVAFFCACLLAGLPAAGQEGATQPRQTVAEANVAIGPGDILDVEVFDTPELSLATAHVSNDGTVTLPVLGVVNVSGLNTSQAARKIESALRTRGIMLQPHVTVAILENSVQSASLLGEVKSPGVYSTVGGRRLLDLIAMAGGLTAGAGKIVTIAHRDDPTRPLTIHLVANAEDLGSQRNPVIEPGDTVMVGRAGIVYILGAVNKPGGFLIDNNEHISLMQALTLAGGWDKAAALSKARLIRKVPGGHEEVDLDLKHVLYGKQADVKVENGDILYLPMSLGKTLAYRGMEAAIAAAQTAVVYTSSSSGG
ncbi:MAG: polysaccharide biosynthesis/export family protein [Acidobacteriaceae bacterium]